MPSISEWGNRPRRAAPSHEHLRLLGKPRDDPAGEAFDKVAKLLGFPYPGGPSLDRLAPYGNPNAVRFTLAKMKGNTLDFSFSGLKAVASGQDPACRALQGRVD